MEKPTTNNIINQQFDLRIKAGIDGEEKCALCRKKAKFLAGDSLRFTKCCWQFICAHDLELKKELFKDEADQCPLCHKNLSVEKIALSNENISFPIIDNYGVEVDISNFADCQAIKQCSMIAHARAGGQGIFDFREKNASATFTNIKLLIDYIKNPRIIKFQSFLTNQEMLRLADYLGAPENILFELANILWEHLQDKESDSKEIKQEKQALRGIAEPYLNCPAYFFQLSKSKMEILAQLPALDLSHATISILFFDQAWVPDENGHLYYICHKFVTLRGFKELAQHLPKHFFEGSNLTLSGHRIQHFCLNDIFGSYDKIDLSSNQISTLDIASNVDNKFKKLNLQYNKMSSLDDNFYKCIRELRTKCKHIQINIRNNPFSNEQKNKIHNQWDNAITMLPERIYWAAKTKYDNLIKPLLRLTSPIIGGYMWGAAMDELATNSSPLVRNSSMFAGIIAGGAWGIGISFFLHDAHNLTDHETTSIVSTTTGGYLATRYVLNRVYANSPVDIKMLALPTVLSLGGAAGFATYAAAGILCRLAAPTIARITHPQLTDYESVWTRNKPELLL
jgi:hypothetical protein